MIDTEVERQMLEGAKELRQRPLSPQRDAERIPHLLARLQAIWEKHPDVRLGQLLSIGASIENPKTHGDAFSTEDEPLIAALEARYADGPSSNSLNPSPARVVRVIDGLGIAWEEQDYSPEAAVKLLTEATTYAHIARGASCTACQKNADLREKFEKAEEALESMGFVSRVRPA